MITLSQLANYFEEGLNNSLNNPEIQFKIWANAGKHTPPIRKGNTVTYFIDGNLRTSTSTNDATSLVMGVNGLTLEFGIYTKLPKTNTKQTEEDLAKIKDGQYPFITYITSAINKYFTTAKVAMLKDDTEEEFSLSWVAGTAISGDVDIRSEIGESILFTVYIELTFVQGGVLSKSVNTYIDDALIPIKAVRYGRSPALERSVNAGKLISKSVATSTAFSIDLEFPANKDIATKECIEYLMSGEPNIAHFLEINFGGIQSELYFMILNTVQTAIQGISIAGITASFIEVVDNQLVFGVPDSFQIGKYTIYTADTESVRVRGNRDCLAFIAGQVIKLVKYQEQVIKLEPGFLNFNAEKNVYDLYLVTNKAVSMLPLSHPFAIIKEAADG